MKIRKNIISLLVLSGIFAALLVSCGKKDNSSVYNNSNLQQNPVKTEQSTNNNVNNSNTTDRNNNTENNIKGSTKMVHLTAAEFKQKVFNYETEKEWKFTGDKPVIIDFYADWCGPCKMVAPVLEELSKEQIYKVDTEEEQELAQVFGIRSIPSILFIPMDGKPQMTMGALPKESFVQAISEVLKVN